MNGQPYYYEDENVQVNINVPANAASYLAAGINPYAIYHKERQDQQNLPTGPRLGRRPFELAGYLPGAGPTGPSAATPGMPSPFTIVHKTAAGGGTSFQSAGYLPGTGGLRGPQSAPLGGGAPAPYPGYSPPPAGKSDLPDTGRSIGETRGSAAPGASPGADGEEGAISPEVLETMAAGRPYLTSGEEAAQAAEEQRKEQWDTRVKEALCGPTLARWKIPLDSKGQMERFGQSYVPYVKALGDPDILKRKEAVTLLDYLLQRAPMNNYVPPDPFYQTCGRYVPDKKDVIFRSWRDRCKADPKCKEKRAALGRKCEAARRSLPADDPRGDAFQKRMQRASPQEQIQAREELLRKGWSLRGGNWYHPQKPELTECSLRATWEANGGNPRLWLEGEVKETPAASRIAKPLPRDRRCRIRKSVELTPAFVKNNLVPKGPTGDRWKKLLDEGGTTLETIREGLSREQLQELLDRDVITKEMVTCPPPEPAPRCKLKPNARVELSKEQIDQYLKNPDGSWKTAEDGRRLDVADIVQQLVDDRLIGREKVECEGDTNAPVVARALTRSAVAMPNETAKTIHVEGSPIPFYGSFKPQGSDGIYAPTTAGSGLPLSAVGGVAAFPAQIVRTAVDEFAPALSEQRHSPGATSLAELTVSFSNGSETWPAFP